MKKILIMFTLIAIVSIAFTSCEPEEKGNGNEKLICAVCVEAKSLNEVRKCFYTESEADTYIYDLIKEGEAAKQSWSCRKE